MPLDRLRALTGDIRTDAANKALGRTLAFVAGAVNAGGVIVVGQYTSHLTGFYSAAADALAAFDLVAALAAFATIACFVAGAVCSTLLIRFGRLRNARSRYALPLLVEAVLLLVFGLIGGTLEHHRPFVVPATVSLLCFVMGLQNALISKASDAAIRTTHLTGLSTDIGIELGRQLFGKLQGGRSDVGADFAKLRLWVSLVALFVLGGVIGALAFRHVGFIATVPLAALLAAMAAVPILDDLPSLRVR